MPPVIEAPAPTVAPSPTPEAPRTPSPALEDFDRTFSDLDETPAPEPPPTPEPTPTPTGTPKDPETGKFVPKTVEPTTPPKPEPAPTKTQGAEFEPPQVAKPSELRNWAKRMGGRAEQAEQERNQLKARIRELESNPAKSIDTKALTEELAATKKRVDEYEGELKITRYERSAEYKTQYEKPYQNAVQNAYGEVKELLVSEPNPEDPENPRERQAVAGDFDEVYTLPLGQATKLAKQKFGDAAAIVLGHRKAIKDAARSAMEAIDSHKSKAAEYEQQQTAQQKMQEEGRARMFNDALTAIADKYKDLLGERDGDSRWNEGLSKGRQMADLAFSDRKQLTPTQSAILDAQIHARVTSFPALKAERDALKSEKAALQKEVEELRASGPGKPGAVAPKSSEPSPDGMTLDQAFDKMVPA